MSSQFSKIAGHIVYTCVFVQKMVVPHDCFPFLWFNDKVAFVAVLGEIALPALSFFPSLPKEEQTSVEDG